MSDALENKAVEILDKSQAAIASFADKLTEMAKQYGPDVADAALQMARVDALNHLVPALVSATGFVIAYRVLRANWKLYVDGLNDAHPAAIVLTVVGGLAGGVLFFATVATLVDVWIWVGIFEPKLWLAKRILGL